MKKWGWLTTLMLVSLCVTTGCSTVLEPAADVLVPVEEEVRLGAQMEEDLAEELDFHDDRQVTNYVSGLGHHIVQQAEDRPEGLEFRFYVVDDDEMINAFAIPGGAIYVYTGLLLEMDNEAELNAVLSHEIAHVTRRHIAQRLVALYGVDLVTQMALGEEPGLLSQLVAAVAQQGFMLGYSREQERNADRWGVQYQVESGYSPQAVISFFEKLEGQPMPPTFLSTHPPPGERIENIRGYIDELEVELPDRLEEQRLEEIQQRIESVRVSPVDQSPDS